MDKKKKKNLILLLVTGIISTFGGFIGLFLILVLALGGSSGAAVGSTTTTVGTGIQTSQMEGIIYYGDYYKSLLKQYLKQSNNNALKGYVTLSRTQLVYEILMDDFFENELKLTVDPSATIMRIGYSSPNKNYGPQTCFMNKPCTNKQLSYAWAVYNNVTEARQKFKEAYELNLSSTGQMLPLQQVCSKLKTSSEYCTSTWISQYIVAGYDSNEVPNSFMTFPFNFDTSWTLTSLFNVYREIVSDSATSIGVHAGWDLAASANTPIYATCDGTVLATNNSSKVNEGGGAANYVKILCDQKLQVGEQQREVEVWYWHVYPNSITVKTGDHITAGTRVAGVGTTGNSTGNHLHLEMVFHDKNIEKLDGFYYINWGLYFENIDADVPINDDEDYENDYDEADSICTTEDGLSGYLNIKGECVVQEKSDEENVVEDDKQDNIKEENTESETTENN